MIDGLQNTRHIGPIMHAALQKHAKTASYLPLHIPFVVVPEMLFCALESGRVMEVDGQLDEQGVDDVLQDLAGAVGGRCVACRVSRVGLGVYETELSVVSPRP